MEPRSISYRGHTPTRAEGDTRRDWDEERCRETAPRLHGRRLVLMRAVMSLAALLAGVLFVASIPAHYEQLRTVCTTSVCANGQLTPESARALHAGGRSPSFYAAYLVMLQAVFATVYGASAIVVTWRAPGNRMALLAGLMLMTIGVGLPNMLPALAATYPTWWLPVYAVQLLGEVAAILFFNLFPSGRFEPRWTRWAALVWLAVAVQGLFFPSSLANPWFSLLNTLGFVGGAGASLGGLIYRYRRRAGQVQRQQIKWVVFGVTTGIGTVVALAIATLFIPPSLRQDPLAALAFPTVIYGAMLLVPLSLTRAVLRHRLWDIDPLINRALVYGALTAGVIGLYVLVVGYLGALFHTRDNLAISLVATGLVAVLFQPLRAWLQRGVNRLLYGERDEPYTVLSRLGRRLEETLTPEAMLQTIVQTVREALKLPYTAVALQADAGFRIAAAAGTPVIAPSRLPLVYQHEVVGELLLAPRAPGEAFSPTDRRLLDDLARHAGIAAHAVRLTTELQCSRERLVMAREEERRRLRRDLHDGLGPRLSSLALQLAAARNRVVDDPVAADLLADLKTQTQEAVADIRRLIYALRPPALDELGLIGAIREHAARSTGQGEGLRVTVEAPDPLPPLPAAIEVAAYRIALEALTNVVRHAQAQRCTIRLALDEASTPDSALQTQWGRSARLQPQPSALCLEIVDNGHGLAPDARLGTGLLSMRERAAELGGACTIAPRAHGGVSVSTRLPLPAPEEGA